MEIDEQLGACGWVVQDYKHAAVAAAQGVAVREVPTEAGPADYVLFVDRQAVGVIEAKKAGSTLTGVEPQTGKYRAAYPEELPAFTVDGALPFGYESTGAETRFTCGLDPVPASRRVFTFHRPETLAHWVGTYTDRTQLGGFVAYPTLRLGIRDLPELEPDPPHLWPAQAEAIRNLEESLRANRPRALIQMATGAGKTFTAANACYRLVRHADAARVLFLVDRANLGRQALREFQGFAAPDDPRKFSELYNVRHLTDSRVDMAGETSAKVHICTIQRLFSILRGDDPEGFDDALDERSGFEVEPTQPVEVAYNPKVPIESYDLIIVDECHRSIYGVWRQVLEYFDAFLVGLTATPGIQTFAFFDQNLVMEYGHAQAVADRVNVDFDVFRIRTEITESGGTVPAEFVTGFRDRDTRQLRLERVDEDIDYSAAELDRRVVAPDQIRTVVRTLRDSLPEIFKDRKRRGDGLLANVPKTLIFAKDDSHADDIVQIVREEFGLSNEGAVKITYRSGDSGNKPEELLQQFRTNYPTRIAVTVDMIATGTDVKPIECVVFMRMVRSRNFFEQMKGRGVRVIDTEDLRRVTPDARAKDRFVIVDAVGVTEAGLHDTVPLERQHGVSFDRLLNLVGLGSVDPDVVSSVASRLARLNRRMTAEDRAEVEQVAGVGLNDLVRRITDALDPDRQHEAAAAATGVDDPTPEQVAAAARQLIIDAVQPIAGNAELREKLVEVRRSYEQVIDTASADRVERPYLRVANVQRGFLNLSDITTIRVDPHKAEKFVLRPGDILFNEGGDRDKLGRGWVWEGQIENCIHQNHVFRARLTSGDFDPFFISMHANTWGQRWFETRGKQTTNLASLNLTTLKSFPVPAPSLDEQQAVVTELQSTRRSSDRLRVDLNRAERHSRSLRRSILSTAFSGQLVPQDPQDEPASVLLERIAASRTAKSV